MVRLGIFVDTMIVLLFANVLPVGLWLDFPLPAYFLAYGILFLAFVLVNIFPLWRKDQFTRLGAMLGGEALLETGVYAFAINLVLTILYGVYFLFDKIPLAGYIVYILLWLLFDAVLALNGCIRVFMTSVQLGIKWRVLLLLLWWMPVVNLFVLWTVCRKVQREYRVETEKKELNLLRQESETCKTKYPLLLVHGVFFRDSKYFRYWGRIPAELGRNGATVYYGNQQSAASTADAAAELKDRILQIVRETGCEKVNIIAHSKGGLEARYAVSQLGIAPYVASLTTINTPHRGCLFVDWLLKRTPRAVCSWITRRYNSTLKKLGDHDPDFYAAVCDLTSKRCEEFNRTVPDAPGVLYQSVGSRMKGWTSAPFPQNLTYLLVKAFDRDNDGLVAVSSMEWGENFRMLTPKGRRGISHGDMVDLYRHNIKGFDVREFYVELVKDLKEKGY